MSTSYFRTYRTDLTKNTATCIGYTRIKIKWLSKAHSCLQSRVRVYEKMLYFSRKHIVFKVTHISTHILYIFPGLWLISQLKIDFFKNPDTKLEFIQIPTGLYIFHGWCHFMVGAIFFARKVTQFNFSWIFLQEGEINRDGIYLIGYFIYFLTNASFLILKYFHKLPQC